MSMFFLLPAALAAPDPGSPEELEAAERTALSLIERCQEAGQTCGATPEALGQAFVVRALAAAVLRGELDLSGVANGRLLAPDVVDAWSSVLPAAEQAAPEAWVVAWLAPPPAPAAPRPASERTRAQRSTPTAVIRASGTAYELGGAEGMGGALDARAEVSEGLGVMVRGTWNEFTFPAGLPARPLLPVGIREVALELSAGPRRTGRGGAELLPHVGANLYSGGITSRTARRLDAVGYTPDPAVVGLGGRLGALGVHPVRPGAPLLFTWRADAMLGFSQTLARPLDGSRPLPDNVVGQRHPLDLWLRAEPGMEWRAGRGLLLGLGAPMSATMSPGQGRVSLNVGAAATLGWTL